MGKLIELAERAERATGPDRELDCTIAKAIGFMPEGDAARTSAPWAWCPRYTASIDAAMQLVPEGMFPLIDCLGPHCRLRDRDKNDIEGAASLAATPALAICASSLRARDGGEGL